MNEETSKLLSAIGGIALCGLVMCGLKSCGRHEYIPKQAIIVTDAMGRNYLEIQVNKEGKYFRLMQSKDGKYYLDDHINNSQEK